MLSQNLEGGSNYLWHRPENSSGTNQLKLPENEVAQNMLNGSLDQSSLISLGLC